MRSLLSILTLSLATLCATLVQARENHALLIGASTYPNLDERYWLVGPANDVDLVRSFLTSNPHVPFADENIIVLADGVDGAPEPTLAAIRQAMADLAARLQPDDFVYLHFSGHGSQAPAIDEDAELDGLDELFLPVDIGPWDDGIGVVQNALVDDEIGQMIASLRATGASVWAVFDSCHSGTVTRAAPTGDDDVRLRKLDASALGIPAEKLEAPVSRAAPGSRPRPESPVDTGGEAGGFVAFYAAQTNETTPEKRLPRGMPGRRSQGVFTFTLFETLAERPGITYRQLGQEILRRYAVGNLARSTPMFEGDLDAPVFGASAAGDAARQWPVRTDGGIISVAAGRLHGLSDGEDLLLLASPADADDSALSVLTVDFADTFSAELTGAEAQDIPRGAYLRKTAQSVDFSLTVALPEPGSPPADKLAAALETGDKEDLFGPRLRFADPGAEADLRLAVLPDSDRPDAIWVLPATGVLAETGFTVTPSIGTGDKTDLELAEVLADTLHRIAKVQNLLKLGGAFGGDDIDVQIDLQTRSPDAPRLRALETLPVPQLIPDDEIHVLARNREDVPVDLNVLYVGSDYSITHMFAGRLQPGDRLKQGLLRITDEAFGRDRVILILSPAKPQSAIEDLSFLEQPDLPPTRAAGGAVGFADRLAEAGFGVTTRAAAPLGGGGPSGPAPAIVMFDLDTRPAN